jgi:hypothetical protein
MILLRKLHDQFIALQSRLLKRSLLKLPQTKIFEEAVDTNDFDKILKAGSELIANYVQPPEEFEKKIQELIRMSDGALRYTFTADQIASTRATRAKMGKKVKATSAVDTNGSSSSTGGGGEPLTFQCPITIENETDPCIIIVEPHIPILQGRGKKFTDLIIDCPLNGLVDEQFVQEVISCMDHPISLKSVREGENLGHQITESPLTRRKILGFLPLGAHETHVAASDWTLQQLFGKGLVLGSRDFWFAVMWYIVYTGRIKYLTEIKDFLTEQMVFRMKNHKHTASLSGLSSFNQTPLRFDCAIMFTLYYSLFTPTPPVKYDPLRTHLLCLNILVELVTVAGLNVPDIVKSHVARIKTLIMLMNYARKVGREALLSVGAALIQNSYAVKLEKIRKKFWNFEEYPLFSLPFIPLDGPATDVSRAEALNRLPKRIKNVPINELYGLIQLVDPYKPTKDIQIELNWVPPPLPIVVHNWLHYEGKEKLLENVRICPSTMRPYSEVMMASGGDSSSSSNSIEEGKEKSGGKGSWNEHMNKIVGDGIILPLHKYYGEFCAKYEVFPSVDEFILYSFHRAKSSTNLHNPTTLMTFIASYAQNVVNNFNEVIKNLKVFEVVKIFEKGGNLKERKQLEDESLNNKGKKRGFIDFWKNEEQHPNYQVYNLFITFNLIVATTHNTTTESTLRTYKYKWWLPAILSLSSTSSSSGIPTTTSSKWIRCTNTGFSD